ncbi:MAG: hypothetical protein J0H05_13115 [Stenotrophomonas acidaminiphila]|uniref:hypothetical protein n=1 Tax=Stenotrophomonas acidaminiphila TaxID=128780 RepID=UPI000AA4510B|nr:hypothetical protein [Stenotrophomonas acidaminiphila]MBN8802588.1 hypothetical protein [Stenotrophomonas acidaminiphila]MDF9443258.1 hypothetical protein [Stenotrophomonas acidaminiphila]
MTPEEAELSAALVDFEQAEERVGLEHQNWSYLQMSYMSFMQSLQEMGLTREEAQERFNRHMSSHSESFGSALEHRNDASSKLIDILRRFPYLLQSLPSKAKRKLGV